MDPKYLRDKNEEEIDIVELLKRVKEGKAPKRILINDKAYEYIDDWGEIQEMYQQDNRQWLYEEVVRFDTKIKILDKPIIEELDENENVDIYELARKVNQIIKHINKEGK